ncbi:AAA family ATPase [Saliterribacillus persicus]|uniref:Putative ATP-dependent endonuclease of OLD family n=1 Tax=Saliterribacillus persicus TaxID=930114 RepID=A0A368X5E4_9BACI|nr:AAA family ATPase [Saliterribacillus persicus]RCW63163.1 putative ATP-dependent endonuclease of OLD family [Saliterribacillus persicus]
MKLEFSDIQNFRKLKSCRVEFSEKETVIVGANNSGKTSAMNALMMFLKRPRWGDLSTTDFTLSNWKEINEIADNWVKNENVDDLDLSEEKWYKQVPYVDVWLQVDDTEVHYVSHLIPSLNWEGGRLGVRLIFGPKNVEELYNSYKLAFNTANKTSESVKSGKSLKLWPESMHDYLVRELHSHFHVKAYILDPSKSDEEVPQNLPDNSEPLDADPFAGLFKIDIINAQRGFSDPNTTEGGANNDRKLSTQLRTYFDKHLNPTELPDSNDLDALLAIEDARSAFDERLKESFKASISELEGLNYPGFSDPQIHISSRVDPLDSLNHDAAVQFNVLRDNSEQNSNSLYLPEKFNGLGYQNLISMIFNLIRFRDEWMRIGKANKRIDSSDDFLEPLHIVMIEEPEAHLHAQVQQVFIKKAYEVLRNHPNLGDESNLSTQLIISTHSSHIAYEIDFVSLRYFKRIPAELTNDIPCAEVVNLSNTFGDDSVTTKFAIRYLKTTHCDLFFADAVILVEGPAERMLVPHFIQSNFTVLDRSYISLLEIGGSHAHRLKPLIESLGILTLVITDLDSIKKDSAEKVRPEKGKGYRTSNDTIKSWVPEESKLDNVLAVDFKDKTKDNLVRVAYQHEIDVTYSGTDSKVIPYTFEDALVLSNISLFKSKTSATGLIKKLADSVNKSTIFDSCQEMFSALGKNSKKAEMALELLYTTEPNELAPPKYIAEGLEWLEEELKNKHKDYVTQKTEMEVPYE